MRLSLGLQVGQIDITRFIASDGHDLESRHDGTGGVGAMSRGRDEAHIAMRFAATGVVSADDEQPGILALRAGVWLQGNTSKPGNVSEPVFQLLKKKLVTARLTDGRKGMEPIE